MKCDCGRLFSVLQRRGTKDSCERTQACARLCLLPQMDTKPIIPALHGTKDTTEHVLTCERPPHAVLQQLSSCSGLKLGACKLAADIVCLRPADALMIVMALCVVCMPMPARCRAAWHLGKRIVTRVCSICEIRGGLRYLQPVPRTTQEPGTEGI